MSSRPTPKGRGGRASQGVGLGEPWSLADSLSGVCADLLSEQRFEPFVRRLFAVPPGSWQPVAGLCDGLAELPAGAAELFASHAAELVAVHLPWPQAGSDGYALVLFVHGPEFWSSMAAYNRQRLEDAEPLYGPSNLNKSGDPDPRF